MSWRVRLLGLGLATSLVVAPGVAVAQDVADGPRGMQDSAFCSRLLEAAIGVERLAGISFTIDGSERTSDDMVADCMDWIADGQVVPLSQAPALRGFRPAEFTSKFVQTVPDSEWCNAMAEWHEIVGGSLPTEVAEACEEWLQDMGWMATDDFWAGDPYRIIVPSSLSRFVLEATKKGPGLEKEKKGRQAPRTIFGDGTWRVGKGIRPGLYQAPGGQGCYWARLRNFQGDIIDNDFNPRKTREVVRILKSDRGFESEDCGTWRRVGS